MNTPSAPIPSPAVIREDRQSKLYRRVVLALTVLLTAGTVALIFAYAYFATFSKFRIYDDEGYFLLSTKLFIEGAALYDQVEAVYQPFFFFLYWLIFKFAELPIGHDSMRLLTISLWTSGAVLTGLLVVRLTNAKILGLLTATTAMLCLSRISNDPGHPHALVYLITVSLLMLIAHFHQLPRHLLTALAATLAGLLFMTKINVGVFVLLPLGLVLAAGTAGRGYRWLETACGVLLAVLPAALMAPRLNNLVWSAPATCLLPLLGVIVFAPLLLPPGKAGLWLPTAAIGLAALLLPFVEFSNEAPRQFYGWVMVTLPVSSLLLLMRHGCRPEIEFRGRDWVWGVAGLFLAVLIPCLFLIWRGTSLYGLGKGFFLLPAGLASVFYLPFSMNLLGGWLAMAGLAACWTFSHLQRAMPGRRLDLALAGARLLLGIGVVGDFIWNGSNPPFEFMPQFWPLPFIWLLLADAKAPEAPAGRFMRLLLVGIGLTQPLVAYPIVGTQLSQSSGIFLIIAAVSLADGLRALLPISFGLKLPEMAKIAAGCALALALLLPWQRLVFRLASEYGSLTPLDLPGASRIRLSEGQARLYQYLCKVLANPEIDTFITMPGMTSFFIWTGKTPLPELGLGSGLWALDADRQEKVWAAIQSRPTVYFLKNPDIARLYTGGLPAADNQLLVNISREFRPVMAAYGYELFVRRQNQTHMHENRNVAE